MQNMAVLKEPNMRRWDEQRWSIDTTIAANGIDFAGPFLAGILGTIGPDGQADGAELFRTVKKYDDVAPMAAAVARRREAKARQAEKLGHHVTARVNYYVASNFWAFAQWPLSITSAENLGYNQSKRDCFRRYAALADHRVEEVWVPFGQGALPAWFHLPPGYSGGRIPAVVALTGMDGFKERTIALYGDPWLERGFAVLAIEGPGQYESAVLGIHATLGGWAEAGKGMANWMLSRPEVDPDRLFLTGRSFGTLFATIAAAHEPRFKACALSAPCLEPGCYTIFEKASPTFKKRFMWMAGYLDEEKFNAFARTISWEGAADKIVAPTLCVTGENDELCPLEHTERMVAAVAGPKTLAIYESARHGIWDVPSTYRGISPTELMVDWMYDRSVGKPLANERLFIRSNGELVMKGLE